MNRLRLVLLPLLAGALFATATAQPAPPAPPAPPHAPRAPKAPKAPKAPTAWGVNVDDHMKDELRRGLAEGIAEVESNDSLPPAIKARILKSLRKAQRSGDPRDLADLSDASGWSKDLSDAVEAEIGKALGNAGMRGGVRIGRGLNVRIGGDDDDDDDDDGDEGLEELEELEALDDIDIDDAMADADRARDRAARARDRAARARDRAARDRDHWDDRQDFGSPFDNPDLGWLENIPFASGALSGGGSDPGLDLDLDIHIDLDDLHLDRGKLAQLDRIASEEHAATDAAERKVKELGRKLQQTVAGPNPNEAEIDRLVDAITAEESRIRKARLGALVRTRKLLGK